MSGALVVAGFIGLSLSAATFMSLDTFDFAIINNLDKRLKTADLVYLGMPFLVGGGGMLYASR